ncbi:hypothetical protein JRC04_04780 [Mycolicibacterium sp. S2-37]|uniref:hypothetical protein n=1 Tax=Mycolicibacterium sp. S2-37 TaxID=2810297 RepID=UPI001A942C48|nr:hypothetical protein [Mycolicibacterium sp. S2-37]MBO0676774.1 hypothetical protein [Mycolicibacterium sp. S2-37]
MPAGPWQLTTTARPKILTGQFDIDSDNWRCALFLSTSNLSTASTAYSAVTNEVTAGNGYTTGGVPVAFTLSGTTSVTGVFTTNPIWAASGGNIVAHYAAVYKLGGDVLALCELEIGPDPENPSPVDVTTGAGSLMTIDSDGTPEPVFTWS